MESESENDLIIKQEDVNDICEVNIIEEEESDLEDHEHPDQISSTRPNLKIRDLKVRFLISIFHEIGHFCKLYELRECRCPKINFGQIRAERPGLGGYEAVLNTKRVHQFPFLSLAFRIET